MSKAQETADAQRHEAKVILLRQFGIAEGESNGTVERFVDCIIGAAMLEAVIVILRGMQEPAPNSATSDNP